MSQFQQQNSAHQQQYQQYLGDPVQGGHQGGSSGYTQNSLTGLNDAPNSLPLPSQRISPTSAPNAQLSQPHLRAGPLDLGFLPAASGSQTSLLEAVVGPTTNAPAPTSAPPSSYTARPAPKPRSHHSRPVSNDQSREASVGSRSFGTSTEREWDVLSDASLKLNEGESEPEAVEELQKKVNKRRSNLPHLESELAALEAQIKAAEERIARAQSVRPL